MRKALLLLPLAALTGGCVSTAASIVTAPFKVVGKAADWATTSQDESDRNYGRKMRKAEAEEGKQRKEWEKRCRKNPDREGCGAYDGYRAGVER
jgi:hypothetical protein